MSPSSRRAGILACQRCHFTASSVVGAFNISSTCGECPRLRTPAVSIFRSAPLHTPVSASKHSLPPATLTCPNAEGKLQRSSAGGPSSRTSAGRQAGWQRTAGGRGAQGRGCLRHSPPAPSRHPACPRLNVLPRYVFCLFVWGLFILVCFPFFFFAPFPSEMVLSGSV